MKPSYLLAPAASLLLAAPAAAQDCKLCGRVDADVAYLVSSEWFAEFYTAAGERYTATASFDAARGRRLEGNICFGEGGRCFDLAATADASGGVELQVGSGADAIHLRLERDGGRLLSVTSPAEMFAECVFTPVEE